MVIDGGYSYSHVHELEYTGVVQRKYALQYENVGRIDDGTALQAGMFFERIHWNLGALAVAHS